MLSASAEVIEVSGSCVRDLSMLSPRISVRERTDPDALGRFDMGIRSIVALRKLFDVMPARRDWVTKRVAIRG